MKLSKTERKINRCMSMAWAVLAAISLYGVMAGHTFHLVTFVASTAISCVLWKEAGDKQQSKQRTK